MPYKDPTSERARASARRRNAKWRAKNVQRERDRHRAWRQENYAYDRARQQQWRTENPDKAHAAEEAWRKANPGRKRASQFRRRLRQERRTPHWVDWQELERIYLGCPPDMVVDHIVPLEGRTSEGYRVSGLHIPLNLQYLTLLENWSKGSKMRAADQELCEVKNPDRCALLVQ